MIFQTIYAIINGSNGEGRDVTPYPLGTGLALPIVVVPISLSLPCLAAKTDKLPDRLLGIPVPAPPTLGGAELLAFNPSVDGSRPRADVVVVGLLGPADSTAAEPECVCEGNAMAPRTCLSR